MPNKKHSQKKNRKIIVGDNRCEDIFHSVTDQPYLDSTLGGRWGCGWDDAPVDKDEHPDINNPLPY